MTTFLRLLKDSDKASALESSLRSYSQGAPDPERTFRVDPDKFRKVPNTPFAYWVDDSIRDLFQKLPPFESEGRTVKQGLATADDFRFVRAWWEVDADRRLDPGLGGAPDWKTDLPAFQAWCRNRTRQGKYWVPFAKGGEYSPYYSDIHLVVNWKNEGKEMKAFSGSVIRNEDFYFRPGVTWPKVTVSGFSLRPLPANCIFSVGGLAAFAPIHQLPPLLVYLNSLFSESLMRVLGSWHNWEAGTLKLLPVPSDENLQRSGIAQSEIDELIDLLCGLSKTPEIDIDGRPRINNDSERNEFSDKHVRWISRDLTNDDLNKFGLGEILSISSIQNDDQRYDSRAHVDRITNETGRNILDWYIGSIFGRWDLRIIFNPGLLPIRQSSFYSLPVVPPGLLVSPNGTPAYSDTIVSEEWLRARPDAIQLPPPGSVARPTIPDSEYPIPVPWDGILAEDPDNPGDLVARFRLVLRVLHGDGAEQAERDLAEGLGVRDLREYVSDPQGFFDAHLKTYSKSRRKAPIYWPLSTKSGGYTVWVYYPRLSDATLYAVHELARKKAEVLDLERAELAGRRDRSRAEQQRFDRVSRDAVEVRDFAQEVLRIAGLPYKPDHDDGVPICAAPLYGLFRHSGWSKYLKGIWEELEEGKYDWAHLAYALWPDRVREKARADQSLAIAHGLEDLR